MEKGLLIVIAVIALIALLGYLKEKRATEGGLRHLWGGGRGLDSADDEDLEAMLHRLDRIETRLSVVERLADLPEAPLSPPSPSQRRGQADTPLSDDHGTPLSLGKTRADHFPR